jgi:hypothetical protein
VSLSSKLSSQNSISSITQIILAKLSKVSTRIGAALGSLQEVMATCLNKRKRPSKCTKKYSIKYAKSSSLILTAKCLHLTQLRLLMLTWNRDPLLRRKLSKAGIRTKHWKIISWAIKWALKLERNSMGPNSTSRKVLDWWKTKGCLYSENRNKTLERTLTTGHQRRTQSQSQLNLTSSKITWKLF